MFMYGNETNGHIVVMLLGRIQINYFDDSYEALNTNLEKE